MSFQYQKLQKEYCWIAAVAMQTPMIVHILFSDVFSYESLTVAFFINALNMNSAQTPMEEHGEPVVAGLYYKEEKLK